MVVRRRHTAANVAPTLRVLRADVNAAYPARLRASAGTDADGIWPSAAHSKASPNSDHEAGNALDIDDDLSGRDGVAPMVTPSMAKTLSLHPSCNYAIHDDMIYEDGVGRAYSGSNKHTGHIHVSVHESKRNDTSHWLLAPKPKAVPEPCVDTLMLMSSLRKAAVLAELKTLGQHVYQLPADSGRAKFLVNHRTVLSPAVAQIAKRHGATILNTSPARWGDTTVREVNPPSGKHLGAVREA